MKKALLVVVFVAVGVAVIALKRPAEVDLSSYEKSVFSQTGEDGVIEKIFRIIPPTTKFAVEFGAADGVKGSNTRNQILNHGWSSLQMEGDEELATQLAANYKDYPEVTCLQAWIYPGNIEILFEENGVPKDFDLLIIDIDSNDYYVWKAIHNYRPKVVMIEFNAAFPPPQLAVVDFHPMNYWDGSDYFGASIQSYYELGKRKGYELIYCNKIGTNLFFVDQKYYKRFGIRDNSPENLYNPPGYGVESGSRAPNGRGFLPFEQSQPELSWKELKIQKKFVMNR